MSKVIKGFWGGCIVLVLLVSTNSCRRDDGTVISDLFANKTGDDCAVSLQYEEEVNTITRPFDEADQDHLTIFDQVDAVPKFERSSVKSCYYKDGTSDMTISILDPSDSRNIDKTLEMPDSCKLTRIEARGNNVQYYNVRGELMAESKDGDSDIVDLSPLLDFMQQWQNVSEDSLQILIAKVKKSPNVSLLNEDIISIRNQVGNSGETMVLIINLSVMLPVGFSIYDSNNKLTNRTVFIFEGNYKSPLLKNMVEISIETSPTGKIRMSNEVYHKFNSFEIQFNH